MNKYVNGITKILSIYYLGINTNKGGRIMKLIMKKTTRRKKYRGFVLKPGFWYGKVQEDGTLVATNCMRRGDLLALYLYQGNYKWERNWVPRDEIEIVFIWENNRIVSRKDGIIDFNTWAEEIYGLDNVDKYLTINDCDPSLLIREYLRYVRAESIKKNLL